MVCPLLAVDLFCQMHRVDAMKHDESGDQKKRDSEMSRIQPVLSTAFPCNILYVATNAKSFTLSRISKQIFSSKGNTDNGTATHENIWTLMKTFYEYVAYIIGKIL